MNGIVLFFWRNQAIAQLCAFSSPKSGNLSDIAMLQQLAFQAALA
jgi:hypothetical protein